MPGVDFDVSRQRISMDDVLRLLKFEASDRQGGQLRGPCPIHGSSSSRSRSFSANLDTGRYYCHKCHSRGNQLELWAAANKLSLYEAVVDLCHILEHEVPWIEHW